MPEISHHCSRTPFLLVGTQIDLREDPSTVEKLQKSRQKPVSGDQGDKLARDLKAVKYVECSALTQVRRLLTDLIFNRKHSSSFVFLFGLFFF